MNPANVFWILDTSHVDGDIQSDCSVEISHNFILIIT